jgi:hypothetical protein
VVMIPGTRGRSLEAINKEDLGGAPA